MESFESDNKSTFSNDSNNSSKQSNAKEYKLNFKKVIAKESRSILITEDNKIFVGQVSFSLKPLSEYQLVEKFDKNIKFVSLGSKHCLITNGKYQLI